MNAKELLEYSVSRFGTIESETLRLSSGNVSHHAATISVYAKNTAEYIEMEMSACYSLSNAESDMLQKVVGWLRDIADLASRLTSGNVSHMGCTIRGKALRCKEYIQKHTEI